MDNWTAGRDSDVGIAMKALERMASIGYHKNLHGDDDRVFGFELESWYRLRNSWSRSDLSPEDISQLFQDAKNLDDTIHILKEMQLSASRLQQSVALLSKPVICKLSECIASVPREILMLIFEFIAPAGGLTSRKQAIWLSHVSRSFRSIALETPSIWATLDGCASKDEFETFVARSGEGSGLHITLYLPTDSELRGFMDRCRTLASRWASLLVLFEDDVLDQRTGLTAQLVDSICDGQLQFPRLRVVRFQQYYARYRVGAYAVFEPWELAIDRHGNQQQVPELQRIECHDYIPPTSRVYDSVKSFATLISWCTLWCNFEDMGLFLPSLRALTVLDLTIHHYYFSIREFANIEIRCPLVSSLTLNLPDFTFPGKVNSAILHSLVASFNMPRLTEYSFSIELQLGTVKDSDKPEIETLFQDLMESLYLDPSIHTNLATFRVKLSHAKGNETWKPKSLTIPLPRIPHVTVLTVQTFTVIEFDAPDRESQEKYALRELSLRVLKCDEDARTDLNKLIKSLQEINTWGTHVTFKKTKRGELLGYEVAAKTAGEAKLSFSY
ncbi:hypothetical protein SCHPADRAFT_1002186 [Schizopora paradoxa]|uniref:Uncharacterized protein n=1 Tax=Schizopora paradoxa TaxID=27342 RepID=A0A0H2R4K6_9AGAM|nr:hypothetical protein SCHPADRAFT_1002186 [Schizopora paradoxa]